RRSRRIWTHTCALACLGNSRLWHPGAVRGAASPNFSPGGFCAAEWPGILELVSRPPRPLFLVSLGMAVAIGHLAVARSGHAVRRQPAAGGGNGLGRAARSPATRVAIADGPCAAPVIRQLDIVRAGLRGVRRLAQPDLGNRFSRALPLFRAS